MESPSLKERPSGVRYIVIGAATLMSVLLYLDRFCISLAEQYIQEDLGLTNIEVGWMISAFFWTYALCQVPAGWLTDRFGSRLMLTWYVLGWSLFTGLTGTVSVFAALLLLRLGFGVTQAGAYPTGSSIVSKWSPPHARGSASAMIAFGGRVGGFLALFLTGYVIVWLTPTDTPTELTAAELLDARQLCRSLDSIEGDDPLAKARRKCLERFSDEAQGVVKTYASPDETEGDKSATGNVVDAKSRQLLVGELNAIIRDEAFFSDNDTQGLAIEKEAQRMLARRDSLSDAEKLRLNRLILEGVFRESVKKIYATGWRPMMFLFGSLGLLVAGLIWWSCRTVPSEHPWVNAGESDLIAGGRAVSAYAREPAPIFGLMKSVPMWMSCFSQWFTNVGWVFLMTWAPRYFTNVHGIPTEARGWMVAIPPMVGWAGMLCGGPVTDFFARNLGLRWGRALPISLSRFLAMAAYIGCLFSPSPWTAVALFSVVAFATDLGTPAAWAFTQDVGGRHVGSVLGWGNMWGNLGAAVAPPFMIWVIGATERWEFAFVTCAGAFLLSGICALGIDASIPIVVEDQEQDPKKASD